MEPIRTGERSRLPNRAAGVRRGSGKAQIGSNRGGRTAGGAARHQLGIGAVIAAPGADDGAVVARLVGRAHGELVHVELDRKSTRLNSSHVKISYAVFC